MQRLKMFLALLLAATQAPAQEVDPADAEAVATAEDKGYAAAFEAAEGRDPLVRDVIEWMRLREGQGSFADVRAFMEAHPDWPGMAQIRGRGENGIGPGNDPQEIVDWFGDNAPRTGIGAARLAEALIALGREEDAHDMLRLAWVTLSLTDDGQETLLEEFSEVLEPLHVERTDAMLWRWRRSDAERMLELLDEDRAAWAEARIGYIRDASNLEELVEAVPEELRQDPGFLYDRYSWLADRGDWTEAVDIALAQSDSAESLGEPFRWSGYRRTLARWLMREERYEEAYELASNHFLTEGFSMVDLEWLSGYLSLRFLDEPARALEHFQAGLEPANVPVEWARMHYWSGRAHEELGAPDLALEAYAKAAEHKTAFYGLVAAERLGQSIGPEWGPAEVEWQGAEIFEDEIVRAAFLLLAAGERSAAVTFFVHLGEILDAAQLRQLGARLTELEEDYYTLILGKVAIRREILIPEIYYPIHPMAEMDLPVDPALALSIARRESEFNPGAGSAVGALGLMQLMPATAEEVAGELDLPYSRGRLTSDWAYNARLGSKYLAMLQEEFGPTPVMIAAGYNAGPSRPKTWMDERGDPRLGEVDILDWIELIPFRETRNYVMHVTESLPLYQARLGGRSGTIRFMDVLIGVKPLLRPIARPEDLDTTPEPEPDADVEVEVPVNEGAPEVRPEARPEAETAEPEVRPEARPEGGEPEVRPEARPEDSANG